MEKTQCLLRVGMWILCASILHMPSAYADEPETNREQVTIMSDGTRLAADLWTPVNRQNESLLPAVLLVHGWGGTKDHLNRTYAPHFAQQGYAVLSSTIAAGAKAKVNMFDSEMCPRRKRAKRHSILKCEKFAKSSTL